MNDSFIIKHLDKHLRYRQTYKTEEDVFIEKKFREFFVSNNIPYINEVAFIRSTKCSTYICVENDKCFFVWDKNYCDILGMLIELYVEAVHDYPDEMLLEKHIKEICGVFFNYLSIKFSHYPVFSKLLFECGKALGMSQDRLDELKERVSASAYLKICKEFIVLHESVHVINSYQKESFNQMAEKFCEYIIANLNNITSQINHSMGYIKEDTIKDVEKKIGEMLNKRNEDIMDEIVADYQTLIVLAGWLEREDCFEESSTMGVVYFIISRFITFNTLMSFINSIWNQLFSYVKKIKKYNSDFKINVNATTENFFSLVRNWTIQSNLDDCVKKRSEESNNEKAYKEYIDFRKANEEVHDFLLNEIYKSFRKNFLNSILINELLSRASLLEQCAKEMYLAEENSDMFVRDIIDF